MQRKHGTEHLTIQKKNVLPRFRDIAPEIFFIELHGCKLKFTMRSNCGKTST